MSRANSRPFDRAGNARAVVSKTLAEVEGPQKTAGEILNVHTWQGEFHNWAVTLGGFFLQLGVQWSTPSPTNPTSSHEVPKPKLPAWVPADATFIASKWTANSSVVAVSNTRSLRDSAKNPIVIDAGARPN